MISGERYGQREGERGSERSSEQALVPQSEIDAANSDIVDVIRKYLPLKKGGKNWSACCPFHSERSASFTVSEEKGMFYCFGCGAGGDAVKFVMDHLGVSFRQAVESIRGRLVLSASDGARSSPVTRAVQCSLPGHAEDREKAARFLSQAIPVDQHPYLMRNNTAPSGTCLALKGSLIVPIINNIGEEVNAAAITSKGITFAAGKPSFGSTAILESTGEHDGKVIICADYAHAWRIWWAQSGRSRVLCTMSADNLLWMLANCRDRYTHVGCDPTEADEQIELGRMVVAVPIDPYARNAPAAPESAPEPTIDQEAQ